MQRTLRHKVKAPEKPATAGGFVFFDPEKVRAKKLEPLSEQDVKDAFRTPSLKVFTEKEKLEQFLLEQSWKNKNLLMMSSGNFGGIKINDLASRLKV